MTALNCLRDPVRLEEARRARDLDPERREILRRLVVLAAELADAPVALVTIVDGECQTFAAHYGLPDELAAAGQTAIDYSLCQFAVTSGRPLIVEELAADPMLRGHPAHDVLGVASYAGVPVVTGSGQALGTVCVLDFVPRGWPDDVLARLALLADLASDQFDLQAHERREAFRRTWQAIPEHSRW